MGFREIIQQIVDGELVTAGVTNRPTQQLDQNVRYVRDIVEAALMGETVIARSRTVEIDALVGQAVYLHAASGEYRRAIGNTETDEVSGQILTSASTQVVGVILRKLHATVADILMYGLAAVDLSESITGDPEVGRVYYLSNTSPGMLVATRPPIGATVLQVGLEQTDGTYEVSVKTQLHELLEAHKHYQFQLQCVPAGTYTPPTPGDRHEISVADDSVEGWLPADDAIFDGNAPEGAMFGYNLSVSSLNDIWPPLPLEGVYLEFNRGEDAALMGMSVPVHSQGLAVIDRNGIWWMSDCYGEVPWPTDYDASSLSESFNECPRDLIMRLTIWFTKPIFQTTGTAVLSLQARTGSGLEVTCVDNGEPASTGHLEIDFDPEWLVDDGDDAAGHLVFKSLVDRTLYRGPAVESLSAGSSNVTLSGVAGEDDKFHGNIEITVDTDLDGNELAIDTTRLNGVTEEFYQGVIALGFDAGRRASFRGRINVPTQLALPALSQLKLKFLILNRSAVDVPADLFTVSYRRIPAPTEPLEPLNLPLVDSSLADLPEAIVSVTAANQYFLMESEAFDIEAGDTVLFTLERLGDSDGFPGNIHVLRQRGALVVPETE